MTVSATHEAFGKVDVPPGASQTITVTIDPRLLAMFDDKAREWRIAPGQYRLTVADSSAAPGRATTVTLPALTLQANWRPGLAAAAPSPQPGERGR